MIGISLSEIVYSIPALLVLTILASFGLSLTLAEVLEFVAVLLLVFIGSTPSASRSPPSPATSCRVLPSRDCSPLFSPQFRPCTILSPTFLLPSAIWPTSPPPPMRRSWSRGLVGYLSLSFTNVVIDWTVLVAVTIALFGTGQDQGAVEGGVGGRNRGEVLGISHELSGSSSSLNKHRAARSPVRSTGL